MPINKSAKKALRKSETRKKRNLKIKEKIKKTLKKVNNLILKKKNEEAKEILPQVYKILDKAAKIGIIKKNTACRKKSQIAKLIGKGNLNSGNK